MSEPQASLPAGAPAKCSQPERRATVRYPAKLRTSWRLYGGQTGDRWSVAVRDISINGIGLVFSFRIECDTLLVVKVQTANENFSRPLLVRVRHVTAHADGSWLVGCTFVRKLSAAALQSLLES